MRTGRHYNRMRGSACYISMSATPAAPSELSSPLPSLATLHHHPPALSNITVSVGGSLVSVCTAELQCRPRAQTGPGLATLSSLVSPVNSNSSERVREREVTSEACCLPVKCWCLYFSALTAAATELSRPALC